MGKTDMAKRGEGVETAYADDAMQSSQYDEATQPASAASAQEKAAGFDARVWVSDFVAAFNLRQFNMHASSTTYFYFLAIIPIIIFISALLPFTDIGESEMISAVDALMPDVVDSFADMVITESFQHTAALIPISVLLLLWTCLQGNMALLRGMNGAYDVKETRPYWLRLVISFVWTTLMMVVFVVLMLLVFSKKIRMFLAEYFPMYQASWLNFSALNVLVCLGASLLFISLTYWVMPNGRRRLRDQLPGAIMTAVLWFGLSEVFSLYVNGFNKFTTFYGTLGEFAISLFWMYCFFYILLLGGFVNCYFREGIEVAWAWLDAHTFVRVKSLVSRRKDR